MTQSVMAIFMSLLLSIGGITSDIPVDARQVEVVCAKQKPQSATVSASVNSEVQPNNQKIAVNSQQNAADNQQITTENQQIITGDQNNTVTDNSSSSTEETKTAVVQPEKKKKKQEQELVPAKPPYNRVDRPSYVQGEVLFLADTDEEAQAIADSYGMNLKSFSYGVGLLDTGEMTAPEAVAYGKENGLHDVELNHIIYIDDPVEKNKVVEIEVSREEPVKEVTQEE